MNRTLIRIDFNARTPDGHVRAGFEDAVGPILEGNLVTVYEASEQLQGLAKVASVDAASRLVSLDVDWDSIVDVRPGEHHIVDRLGEPIEAPPSQPRTRTMASVVST